jgi:outer membrane protein OmpA-like peptidoglycan-associated protein
MEYTPYVLIIEHEMKKDMKNMRRTILLTVCAIMAGIGQMTGQTIFDRAGFVIEHPDSINSVASEIGPCKVGNQLYFSAVRRSWWEKQGRVRRNTAFYNQYQVPVNAEGRIQEGIGRKVVPGLDRDYHQGPVSYCAATGELFVTESNISNPDSVKRMIPSADIRLNLVIMKQKPGTWEKVSELPFNDKRYHYAHPAISVTGDTLVFSSDQPGGFGQSDLYMSIRKSGQWSTPVNLGDKINTKGNEFFPTFLPGGLLSFASNGHTGGFGFLDIWYTSFPVIGEVKNAGDKINTQFDDFGLIIDPGLKTGYLSSNRQGTGSDDIFRIDISLHVRIVSGVVLDAENGQPLGGTQVRVLDCNGKQKKTLTADNKGAFRAELESGGCYQVEAGMEGYEKGTERVGDNNYIELKLKRTAGYQLLVVDASDRKVIEGVRVSCKGQVLGQTSARGVLKLDARETSGCHLELTAEGYLKQGHDYRLKENQGMRTDTVHLFRKEVGKKFVLQNIHYDYNKWDILPESAIELDKLVQVMQDNPDIRVELGSHTDSRGNDQYNMRLSQKRSDSAVAYIVSKSIDRSRIKAKGYGETQLINRCKNGVNCSDQEHRQNRRTEFKIIGL